MDERIKTLIRWWQLKGQQESDPFIKFFFFYVCFDAWITAGSGEENEGAKRCWLVSTNNCLNASTFDFWESPQTQLLLTDLKQLSSIKDMRPNQRGKQIELKDINNIGEVVRFIYQIRCNFFHGSKSPKDSRDAELVDLSGRLLEQWITWAFDKCL